MSPCQPIASLGRPSEGGLTGSPDAGRCSAGAAPSSPSRRRRRRVISSARLSAPSRRPLRRGTGWHCPPAGQGRAGPGKVLTVTCTCRKQPEGPLSFTVPSCGAAQGRLPERPKGAVCKTVGFAFPGSNPGPATTCGNGRWPADSAICETVGWARPGPAGSRGVPLFAVVHGHIADRIRDHEARSAARPYATVRGHVGLLNAVLRRLRCAHGLRATEPMGYQLWTAMRIGQP
jgi:hypothetical protein